MAVGIDDREGVVFLNLHGRNVLLGGLPGSGKSNSLRVFLAGLACRREVCLLIVDPKHAEGAMWMSRASEVVLGNEARATTELLSEILAEIQRRSAFLAGQSTGLLLPGPVFPWLVLLVDEWAEVGAGGSPKERQVITEQLRRIASLGRAVGVSVILATQRPTSDVIDSSTRALLSDRIALRCMDRWTADAILGPGVAGPDALRRAAPGWALWSNGGPPSAFQFYEVPDIAVPALLCAGYRPGRWQSSPGG
jgi:S-DNA-T family DNA segregation ATPase FtsK/SpoIIIE